MSNQPGCSTAKAGPCMDADVRARIQESHKRAKFVLEASKLALDAQSEQLGGRGAGRLDISNLFGQQSYTLPSNGSPDRLRRSLSPRPSFDPVQEDMQSTRKSIAATVDDTREYLHPQSSQHMRRSSTRNRAGNAIAHEMSNRSGARAVAANMNGSALNKTNVRELTVNNILAASRSERVRRLSQTAGNSGQTMTKIKSVQSKSRDPAVAMFERDENDFIAEIPVGFQPSSPPTCESSRNRKPQQYSDAARIPIELDDFGGEGYLLENDYSFGQMCNKMSNRTDSICLPMEQKASSSKNRRDPVLDSFFDKDEIIVLPTDGDKDEKENRPSVAGGSQKQKIKQDIPSCKLLGGDLDGSVCLDCSKQCKCVAEYKPAGESSSSCRSPKKDCKENRKDKMLDSGLGSSSCGLQATTSTICKTGDKSVAPLSDSGCAKKENKKNMEYCDQHLSYLDRVMKSLDLKQDSSVCGRKSTNSCNPNQDVQVVAARKAKSMLASDCCGTSGSGNGNSLADQFFGSKLSDVNSCCSNNEDGGSSGGGKTMSVYSQQFSSRDGNEDGLRRAHSQMSTMSDFNFVNGYLPLKSTHNEISWPSVKLRKSVTKSFQIKNTSTKRLIIRVILDGPGFNFENPEANARGTMTLQPNEVRTLTLIFNPTVLGPAVGNLIFQPPIEYCAAGGGCATMSNINSRVTKRVIRLYGYGGHVAMSFERLQQGPVGTKFLPLGNLCNLNKVFEESFIIRNKGNLTGFAAIMLENKTVGKSMFDKAIGICPDKVLIPANSAVKVKVSFQPTGSDMKEMMKIHRNQEVIAIGNILVVTGDEPTRCRMKRLISASKELADKYSSAQLRNIWADYGANDCDYELTELRETGLAVADLMGSFQSKEVALTVNNSTTDMSLIDASGWISDVEDNDALFHTICQPNENTDCCKSPPGGDLNMMPLASMANCKQEEDPCNLDEWHVEPRELSFNTNSVLPRVLTIHSKVAKDRMFEVDSNVANYFCVSPQEGVITPSCNKTNISVRMMNYNIPPCPLYIYIYIENDRICVPVQVERGPPEGPATCAKVSCEKVANVA